MNDCNRFRLPSHSANFHESQFSFIRLGLAGESFDCCHIPQIHCYGETQGRYQSSSQVAK